VAGERLDRGGGVGLFWLPDEDVDEAIYHSDEPGGGGGGGGGCGR
jgi:hypothetical protein